MGTGATTGANAGMVRTILIGAALLSAAWGYGNDATAAPERRDGGRLVQSAPAQSQFNSKAFIA